MKGIGNIISQLSDWVAKSLPIDSKVRYSVKKYTKTYELLEEFDKKAIKDPKALADPERLSPYIRQLQKGARDNRRTNT